MKRVIIGALVAAVIAFALQAVAWMGNFYPNFAKYTSNQDAVIEHLSQNLSEDGLYYVPYVPADASSEQREEYAKTATGKPWAMVFYHQKMEDAMGMSMTMGFIHNFIAAFFVGLILFYGNFKSYWGKFFVTMGIFIIVILVGVMDEVLWWTFPGSFIYPQIIDILVDWGIASFWLAFFIKPKLS